MSSVGDFVGDVFGGITGSKQSAQGAEAAAASQDRAASLGIEESKRQFDALVQLMRPFVETGTSALEGQKAFLGLDTPERQREIVKGVEESPIFGSLIRQGEEAILQNAAATGGLRGGNTQEALAKFRPQILSQLLENQYQKLGGLAQLGQASAAGQGSAGIQTGANIANLFGQAGAATAGGQLARGNVARQTFGDVMDIAKVAAGAF